MPIRPPRPRLEPLETRETPSVAGDLDPTFGTGGFSPTLGGPVAAVAVDPLGRVLLAGSVAGPGGHDFLVARLTSAGTPDPSFGTNGQVAIDFGGGDDAAGAVALDPAGRVVVAGTSTAGGAGRFAVARLTPAGAPDPGFGSGGTAAFHIGAGSSDTARGVAVDPADDGVVVGGSSTGGGVERFAVARLTAAGVLDPGFAGGGATSVPVAGAPTERALAVTLDPSRRIVLAGYTFTPAPAAMRGAVVRLTPAGAPDATFSGDGIAFIPDTFSNSVAAVAADPAGNIFTTGSELAVVTNLTAAKLTPAGDPDPGFGTGGLVRLASPGPSGTTKSLVGIGVALQSDGMVVLTANDSPRGGTVIRLTPTGIPDPSFGRDPTLPGRALVPGVLEGVALAPDGRIVVAANDTVTGQGRAARLLAVTHLPPLAVSGRPDGTASLFPPDPATGQYPATPAATLNPFGGAAVNVRTAVGDVDGDGIPDTLLVTGPGTAIRVAAVSGKDNATMLVAPFDPFGGDFTGGGFVAAADLDHDGRAEFVVSPDRGGGPRVSIFSLNPDGSLATRANFFGIDDPNFRGGARPALGDVNGDGVPDLVVAAGFLGGPRAAIFDGKTVLGGTPARLVNDFFAFPGADATTLRNGVFVAAGDVDGDGKADLIFGGGPGGAPRVFILSGARVAAGDVGGAQANPVANFFVAGNSSDRGGVRVAATDADGDNRADVVAGSGEGSASRVRVYLGKDFTGAGEPTSFQDLDPFGGAALTDGVFVG